MELFRFIIYGKVQRVYYRKFVSQALMRKQVRGYIRNLPDGTVEVVAELIDDDLDDFMQILRDGSPQSVVEDIEYESIEDADLVYDGFEIR
ncbi:Acylphosphate phosphohydrolase, putative [hydrothermal vent metagenome]|uniref:Acylphosphate phosphohydrolase, putative n=1 Tax=hydrothermal vent metagenome TaxID=652676 RepID=A0A1W1B8S9_9ZZZZ